MANNSVYGLAASVWTGSMRRAHRVADRIEAGTVWINCWMVRDLRVYGRLLADQRHADLAGSEPGFLAKLRK